MVTAYNAVRDFVTSQQTLSSDGTVDSSSVLFGDATMRNIMTQMEAAVNSSVGGMSLSDLGLSFNENNELEVTDASKLKQWPPSSGPPYGAARNAPAGVRSRHAG